MSEPKKILILNGPNINLTGLREKAVYGAKTYDDLLALCHAEAEKLGVEVRCVQSNHEGDLIDALQKAYFDGFCGAVFNPVGTRTRPSRCMMRLRPCRCRSSSAT